MVLTFPCYYRANHPASIQISIKLSCQTSSQLCYQASQLISLPTAVQKLHIVCIWAQIKDKACNGNNNNSYPPLSNMPSVYVSSLQSYYLCLSCDYLLIQSGYNFCLSLLYQVITRAKSTGRGCELYIYISSYPNLTVPTSLFHVRLQLIYLATYGDITSITFSSCPVITLVNQLQGVIPPAKFKDMDAIMNI